MDQKSQEAVGWGFAYKIQALIKQAIRESGDSIILRNLLAGALIGVGVGIYAAMHGEEMARGIVADSVNSAFDSIKKKGKTQ